MTFGFQRIGDDLDAMLVDPRRLYGGGILRAWRQRQQRTREAKDPPFFLDFSKRRARLPDLLAGSHYLGCWAIEEGDVRMEESALRRCWRVGRP